MCLFAHNPNNHQPLTNKCYHRNTNIINSGASGRNTKFPNQSSHRARGWSAVHSMHQHPTAPTSAGSAHGGLNPAQEHGGSNTAGASTVQLLSDNRHRKRQLSTHATKRQNKSQLFITKPTQYYRAWRQQAAAIRSSAERKALLPTASSWHLVTCGSSRSLASPPPAQRRRVMSARRQWPTVAVLKPTPISDVTSTNRMGVVYVSSETPPAAAMYVRGQAQGDAALTESDVCRDSRILQLHASAGHTLPDRVVRAPTAAQRTSRSPPPPKHSRALKLTSTQ
jgi:hypothetical protein